MRHRGAHHGTVRPHHREPRTFVPDGRGLIIHHPTDEMNSMTTGENTTEARLQAFLAKAKDGISGQDAAIDALAAELARRLETRSDHRPLAVLLLAGPDRSGTKADLVGVLADALDVPIHQYDLSPPWGEEDALIFLGPFKGGISLVRDRLDPDLVRVKAEGAETIRLVLGDDGIRVVPLGRPLQEEPQSSPGTAAQEGSGDE